MDTKEGVMMCKLKGWIDQGGHYDFEKKGWMEKEEGNMMCKLRGWIDTGGH